MYQEKGENRLPAKKQVENKPYSFSDEDTKKKIKRHLSDINDVITEYDIQNVKIPGNEPFPAAELKRAEDNEGRKLGSGVEGRPGTPWDIID